MKNKILLFSVALILVISLVVASCAAPAPTPTPTPAPAPTPAPTPAPAPSEPIVLRAIGGFPDSHQTMQSFYMLRDRVNERAKGELIIDHIGGPETIGLFDQGSAVAAGVVDMSLVFSAAYAGLVPGENLLTVSRVPYDKEREIGFHDLLEEMHAKAGLYFLGRGAVAYGHKPPRMFNMWLNKSIETPYDLVGMKLACAGPAMNAFVKALGMTPVVMGIPDLYAAMERGVVDGMWTGMSAYLGIGGLEVSKYAIRHGFATDNMAFIINLDTWNSLPGHLQNLLTEVAIEVERDYPAIGTEYINSGFQKMEEAGLEIIEFSPSDADWFVNLFYEAEWEKLRSMHPEVAARAWEILNK